MPQEFSQIFNKGNQTVEQLKDDNSYQVSGNAKLINSQSRGHSGYVSEDVLTWRRSGTLEQELFA